MPVPAATMATVVALLVHEPPVVVLLSVIVAPMHTLSGPVTGAVAVTVTVLVVAQPVESV
jgi:hypothetical protein